LRSDILIYVGFLVLNLPFLLLGEEVPTSDIWGCTLLIPRTLPSGVPPCRSPKIDPIKIKF